jgi:hypothetical protein
LQASPITLSARLFFRKVLIPLRTTAWSSTIMTEIGSVIVILPGVDVELGRSLPFRLDLRAALRPAFDRQFRAYGIRPLSHDT